MRALGVRFIVIEKVRNYYMEKFYSSETYLKMVGGGAMHTPHSPLDPPLNRTTNTIMS